MNLTLDHEDAVELHTLLDQTLGDLSAEIASTDNAEFRRALRARRDRFQRIQKVLESVLESVRADSSGGPHPS